MERQDLVTSKCTPKEMLKITYFQKIKQLKKLHSCYLVSCHQPNTVASDAVPESQASIARSGADIVGVGMEGEAVHVGEVPVEDPKRLGLVGGPEPGRFVVAARGKVVAKRREHDVPHGQNVTLDKNKPKMTNAPERGWIKLFWERWGLHSSENIVRVANKEVL